MKVLLNLEWSGVDWFGALTEDHLLIKGVRCLSPLSFASGLGVNH